MKYLIDIDYFLNESKQDIIISKFKDSIPDYYLEDLIELDTTPTKKYLEKILYYFVNSNGDGFSKFLKIKDNIPVFDYLVNRKIIRGSETDITKYKKLDDLIQVVQKYEHEESKTLIKKLNASNIIPILKSETLNILVPLDKKAAQIYGSGSKFCISAKFGNEPFYGDHFSDRHDDNVCFVSFIIDNTLPTNNPLYKIAVEYTDEYPTLIHDALDSINYKHCLEKSNLLDIPLPQEYHDTMKQYNGSYEEYVKKHLKINIKDLNKKIKNIYHIKQ